jgi:deoxyhypusine synthase
MDRLSGGMYTSKLISYDSTKKTYTVKNFDIKNKFEKQTHLNPNPLYSAKAVGRSSAKHILFPRAFETFTSFGDTTNARIVQERISFLKMAEAQKIVITVPGRADYTVGQVAEVTLYKKQPMTKKDRHEDLIDDVNSGKYLVAAINHQISIDGHTCYIELIKDSMKKKVM